MNREVDRISNLPDSILHNILSLLVDIKFVVQTCVLSKRWRYIWTSLPVLKISEPFHYCHEEEGVDEFDHEELQAKRLFKFVDKVLDLRDDHSDIQKFHLEFGLSHPPVSKMHRWIGTAVSHNVQKLKIVSRVQGILYNFKARPENGYEIPPCLCTCQSLTKLKLEMAGFVDDGDKIILPREMILPQLKSLHLCLKNMAFNDEILTNRFFSSFPSLESLIVKMGSTGFRNMNLHISLPKLKYFEFRSWVNGSKSEVKVYLHAPNLSSFIFNSDISTSFTLENLSPLPVADIKIHVKYEDQVAMYSSEICAEKKEIYARHTTGLLRGIQNVKVLTLDDSVLKALGGAPDILDTQLSKFYNLQHLELQTCLSRGSLHSILYILKNSPNIESVSLLSELYDHEPGVNYYDEVKFNPENIGDYWDAGLSLPCMLCHLKVVKFQGLCGCVNELKFLEILLKHGTVLEKVVLASYSTNQESQDSQRKFRMMKFRDMLLKFPTASKKIHFC